MSGTGRRSEGVGEVPFAAGCAGHRVRDGRPREARPMCAVPRRCRWDGGCSVRAERSPEAVAVRAGVRRGVVPHLAGGSRWDSGAPVTGGLAGLSSAGDARLLMMTVRDLVAETRSAGLPLVSCPCAGCQFSARAAQLWARKGGRMVLDLGRRRSTICRCRGRPRRGARGEDFVQQHRLAVGCWSARVCARRREHSAQ